MYQTNKFKIILTSYLFTENEARFSYPEVVNKFSKYVMITDIQSTLTLLPELHSVYEFLAIRYKLVRKEKLITRLQCTKSVNMGVGTHVYKHEMEEPVSSGGRKIGRYSVCAVSYTHLDVYKRQTL